MKKWKLTVSVSCNRNATREKTIDLKYLGYEEEDWSALTKKEQEAELDAALVSFQDEIIESHWEEING